MVLERCPKNRYCAFKDVFEDTGGKVERCIFCGRRVFYRKRGGSIDNLAYLKAHVRDFCQPAGPTKKVYEEIYGKASLKSYEELRKQHDLRTWKRSSDGMAEKHKEVMDYYRTLGKESL